MTRGTRKHVFLLVGIALSALFLWIAARDVDFHQIRAALAAADARWAVLVLVLLAGFCFAKAWRWSMLLGLPTAQGTLALTRAVLVGYAATSLLPLQLGEVVRAWAATRVVDRSLAPIVVSIALERVLDLFAVLAVLATVLLLGGPLPVGLLRAGWLLGAASLFLLIVLVIYVAYTDATMRVVARFVAPMPERARAALLDQLRRGAAGAASLRSPSMWLQLAVSSLAQWLLMAGCIAASCAALGLDLPFAAAGSVLGLTIIGMSLPSGPGYVGSIQLAFTLGLDPFGIAAGPAIAASLFYHLLVCGSLIAAGLVALHRLGGTLRTIVEAPSAGQPPPPGL
jgi:glycosyltransferase 2 family protein